MSQFLGEHMPNKFKTNWSLAPRSSAEKWKGGVTFTFEMRIEEIDALGQKLLECFPGSIFYSKRINLSKDTSPKSAHSGPFAHGTIGQSIRNLAQQTNSASVYFRHPWPEDYTSGSLDDLQNYQDQIAAGGRREFRRIGRCVAVSFSPTSATTFAHKLSREVDGRVEYANFSLISSSVTISAVHDREDPEVTAFLDDIEGTVCEVTTSDFASYDPFTRKVINPMRRDATQRRSAGIVRYVALNEAVYFGFCHRGNNPPELMGVRPELRSAIRAEAGLPEE
jgi:hypothetical protein